MECVRPNLLSFTSLLLKKPSSALRPDSCLYVVPRSHNQVRTPEQRKLSETLDAPENPLDMPGAIQVDLLREPSHRYFLSDAV
jgi:hypothetical protein